MGICFPLSQVLAMVLEASSQWDEGTRAVSGSSHAGCGTIRTSAWLFASLRVGPPGTPLCRVLLHEVLRPGNRHEREVLLEPLPGAVQRPLQQVLVSQPVNGWCGHATGSDARQLPSMAVHGVCDDAPSAPLRM